MEEFSSTTRTVANAIAVCALDLKRPVQSITWNDFKDWALEKRGLSKEELKEIQGDIKEAGGFNNLRDALYPATPKRATADKLQIKKLVSSQKEATVALARQELFLTRFEEVMTRAFKAGVVKANPFVPKKGKKTSRILNLLLSDLHFGSGLDGKETLDKYTFTEEARRLAHIVKVVSSYKMDHRDETTLVVNLAGDIIDGRIHDKAAGIEEAIQNADAVHLLVSALRIFGNSFKEVVVNCTTGNHDRSSSRHTRPAVQGKYDSEATKIYWALKVALADYPNVKVSIPYLPFITYDAFGARIYVTHGDNNLETGPVGSRLDVRSLETKINAMNIAFTQRKEKPIDLFAIGHIHIGTVIHLPMAELITNGTLQPSNQYGLAMGYYGNACGQSMWESVEGHVLGDYRFITVDPSIDKDESLDTIIQPFQGL